MITMIKQKNYVDLERSVFQKKTSNTTSFVIFFWLELNYWTCDLLQIVIFKKQWTLAECTEEWQNYDWFVSVFDTLQVDEDVCMCVCVCVCGCVCEREIERDRDR